MTISLVSLCDFRQLRRDSQRLFYSYQIFRVWSEYMFVAYDYFIGRAVTQFSQEFLYSDPGHIVYIHL